MVEMARIQQEHSGFWPESHPSNGIEQHSITVNGEWPFSGAMQAPPPPPDEPYPY